MYNKTFFKTSINSAPSRLTDSTEHIWHLQNVSKSTRKGQHFYSDPEKGHKIDEKVFQNEIFTQSIDNLNVDLGIESTYAKLYLNATRVSFSDIFK